MKKKNLNIHVKEYKKNNEITYKRFEDVLFNGHKNLVLNNVLKLNRSNKPTQSLDANFTTRK